MADPAAEAPIRFSVRYDDAVLLRAVHRMFWRRVAKGFGRTSALAIVAVAGALIYSANKGTSPWFTALGIGFLVLLAATLLVAWFLNVRLMKTKLAGIPSRTGTVTVGIDELTVETEAGTGTWAWRDFTELWRMDGMWMLFLAPVNFVSIPTAGVSEEALAAVAARFEASR